MAPSIGSATAVAAFVVALGYFAVSATATSRRSDFVQIVGGDDAGSFNVVVDGQVWLQSATPSLKVDGVHSPLSLLKRWGGSERLG